MLAGLDGFYYVFIFSNHVKLSYRIVSYRVFLSRTKIPSDRSYQTDLTLNGARDLCFQLEVLVLHPRHLASQHHHDDDDDSGNKYAKRYSQRRRQHMPPSTRTHHDAITL